MTEWLQEICDWRGGVTRIDAAAGVIRGVKVLGTRSRNGREYLPEALAVAQGLYEGAKVNVNHPKRAPHEPRDYQDRLGVIRHVEYRPQQGLFGDLYFNPRHALAEQLLWDAQHAPENVGLSHNVEARTSRQGERTVVEAIVRVQSVDLVADPATTRGLFEATTAAEDATAEEPSASLAAADFAEGVAAARGEHGDETTDDELQRLQQRVAELEASDGYQRREAAIEQIVAESGLAPATDGPTATAHINARFVEILSEVENLDTVRALVHERAQWLAAREQASGRKPRRPQSCDQHTAELRGREPLTSAEWARQIRLTSY